MRRRNTIATRDRVAAQYAGRLRVCQTTARSRLRPRQPRLPTSRAGSSLFLAAEPRELDLIDETAVLVRRIAMHRLANEAGLLEHAHRCGIPGEDECEKAVQPISIERRVANASHRSRRDASPPKLLTEPIAKLRGILVDVIVEDDAKDRKSTRLNSSHRTISY